MKTKLKELLKMKIHPVYVVIVILIFVTVLVDIINTIDSRSEELNKLSNGVIYVNYAILNKFKEINKNIVDKKNNALQSLMQIILLRHKNVTDKTEMVNTTSVGTKSFTTEIEVANKSNGLQEYLKQNELSKFIDMNEILDIEKNIDSIKVSTKFGSKVLDRNSMKWKYRVYNDGKSSDQSNSKLYRYPKENELPNWYKGWCYTEIMCNKNNWILTSLAGEGATREEQNLIDVSGKKVYVFPFENITMFLVDDNEIWLGSKYSLININLIDNTRKDFLTLPAISEIVNYYENEESIYYGDKHYGVYMYRKDKEIVEGIKVINDINDILNNESILLADIKINDNNMYVLGNKYDQSKMFLNGDSSILFIYNLSSKTLFRETIGIRYLGRLIDLGSSILAYGAKTEDYEGGETMTYGGMIIFDKKSRAINKITEIPISRVEINENRIKAISVTTKYDSSVLKKKELEYLIDDNVLRVVESIKYIRREGRKKGDIVRLENEDYTVPENDEEFEAILKNHKANDLSEAKADEFFSKLQVHPTTIVIDRGAVRVKKGSELEEWVH